MNRARPIHSEQFFVGVQYGYIIVPSDVDRTKFIQQCYRWERVSILIEHGAGIAHECYISRPAMRDIVFPQKSEELGSCVLFFTDARAGHPIIFDVISKEDESQLLKEGFFKIAKEYAGGSVSITGDAQKGILNLSVNGGSVSQLNITVANVNKNATVNFNCQGNINLKASGEINMLMGDLFKINTGSEAMVKGDELKAQLEKTNEYLTTLRTSVQTALVALDALIPGTSASFVASMTGKAVGDYADINSVESFLD